MAQSNRDPADKRPRIRRRALLTALAGLLISTAVYFTAPVNHGNPLGNDPMDSKTYLRQLELYGGDANLLSVEFQQWFLALWHGRKLACTLLVIFLAASALYWLVAGRMELLRRIEEGKEAPPPGR
jgi:hypothetical protein